MSIEMFEHMRNWQALLGRVAGWLEPGSGKAFVQSSATGRCRISSKGRGRPTGSSPRG